MKKFRVEIIFVILCLMLLGGIFFSNRLGLNLFVKNNPEEIPTPEMLFGFPVDSFRITEGTIEPNENIGDILSGFGLPLVKIDRISRNAEGVFNLRKIKSGQRFYLFQSVDTSERACYFVYEKNLVEYVIFNLKDSLGISLGKKNVRVEHQSASGIILSNLWNTITDNNLSPMLALELSEIYAWSIDFFGIQKGDRFRVLYDEQFVDSVSIGVGPIYAAEFEHAGKSYIAFRFFQNKRYDYFNDMGENLRKEFLKAPLKFFRISSRFSESRFHPILKIRRPHHGVDYAAPKGTPVLSIGDGTVTEKNFQSRGGGNYLMIKHNTDYSTSYMHLSGFGKGISKGSYIRQGDIIGFVGATGLATGPHLDFRVYKNGIPIDPLKMEAPPSDPVKKEFKNNFIYLRDSLMARLYTIAWPNE